MSGPPRAQVIELSGGALMPVFTSVPKVLRLYPVIDTAPASASMAGTLPAPMS